MAEIGKAKKIEKKVDPGWNVQCVHCYTSGDKDVVVCKYLNMFRNDDIESEEGTVDARAFVLGCESEKVFSLRLEANPNITKMSYPQWKDKEDNGGEGSGVVDIDRKHVETLRSQGLSLKEWIERNDARSILFASNGIQTNYIAPYGFCVVNGRQQRQAYAMKSRPIADAWALVVHPRRIRGVRRVRFADDGTVIDDKTKEKITQAIGGVPLICAGKDVSAFVRSTHGKRSAVDAVAWNPRNTKAAFSAVGVLPSGEIVFFAMKLEVTIYEVASVLVSVLGLHEAVLCGGSADVQQYVRDGKPSEFVVGNSRHGSTNPGAHRRLNNIFVVRAS